MKNYAYTRDIAEKLSIKGKLSNDCTTISYYGENDEINVDVMHSLKNFAGREITFSVTTKTTEDLNESEEE